MICKIIGFIDKIFESNKKDFNQLGITANEHKAELVKQYYDVEYGRNHSLISYVALCVSAESLYMVYNKVDGTGKDLTIGWILCITSVVMIVAILVDLWKICERKSKIEQALQKSNPKTMCEKIYNIFK